MQIAKALRILLGHPALVRDGVVDPLELRDAERRLHVRQPQVAAELLVQEASRLPEAEVAERAQALGEVVVVGQHHPALTRRDQLVGVEAEGAQRPEAAAAPPRRARGRATREVFRPVGLGGVLDDRETVPLRELEHGVHVDRVAVDVDGHDRSRARADPRRDLIRIQAPGLRIAVDEHGTAPASSTAPTHEMIVNVGRITSSPGSSPSAATAASSAAVPLLTATPCRRPQYAAQPSSNSVM